MGVFAICEPHTNEAKLVSRLRVTKVKNRFCIIQFKRVNNKKVRSISKQLTTISVKNIQISSFEVGLTF